MFNSGAMLFLRDKVVAKLENVEAVWVWIQENLEK